MVSLEQLEQEMEKHSVATETLKAILMKSKENNGNGSTTTTNKSV